MHNNNTTTTIARGCQWCATCLYGGWGEGTDDEAKLLGDAVCSTFHAVCKQLNRSDIHWIPQTSEVHALAECDPQDRGRCHAGTDGGRPHIDLDALRAACSEVVMERLDDVLTGGDDLSEFLDAEDYELAEDA